MKTIVLFFSLLIAPAVFAAECRYIDGEEYCKVEAQQAPPPAAQSAPAALKVVMVKPVCPPGTQAQSGGDDRVLCIAPAPAASKMKTIATTAVITAGVIAILNGGLNGGGRYGGGYYYCVPYRGGCR